MIKQYDDLTEAEQDKLSKAWQKVYKGLQVYEEVTSADLQDIVHDELGETIEYQASEEEE
jgi:hypothetical protein